MVAERAGYTVIMFLIDVSPSMGTTRTVELPDGPDGEKRTREMTNLEWSLHFVMLKIQEMIFNGRKTDQCGVILFGTEDTDNIINDKNGGYDHVSEYIPIGQPNATTLSKLQALRPSTVVGDPIDAIIVGVETQDKYLGNRKTWTRKMALVTDGENPIEVEDWELTVKKMNQLNIITTIIGIDFDDEEFGFEEEEKSHIKKQNEAFYAQFVSKLDHGVVGTAAYALQECVRPEVKVTKSALSGQILRIGDVDARPEDAVEIIVKTSKCTAKVSPPSLKKFVRRTAADESGDMDVDSNEVMGTDKKDVYAELKMRTEYVLRHGAPPEGHEEDEEKDEQEPKDETSEKVDQEQLIRGFKYGASYAPCPDGQFPRLNTRRGIDVCGFFPDTNLRRDYAMGEVYYIWADPSSGQQQVAFSSLVHAMIARGVVAIARWVSRDDMDPKMGVLVPREFERVDCFLWLQMPFADDVKKYTFPSLTNLVSKKGEQITKHPYLPTDEQLNAMDQFVDAMDLMQAGEKDENGDRQPWFDPRLSYNPAVHRIKQALFHAAIVTDLHANPLPPPHPEVAKYLEPPRRAVKRARDAAEECKRVFAVKQVPKKVVRKRKDGHVRAEDDDEELLLLDQPKSNWPLARSASQREARLAENGDGKPVASSSKDADEMDVDQSEVAPKPESKRNGTKARLPTPDEDDETGDVELTLVDEGRDHGRIIGRAHPLRDFKKNMRAGDIVSKAVEDLAWVIKEIVTRPFASRRHDEMVECMKELRHACLTEDEIESWNAFLRDLKVACLAKKGINNRDFWAEVQKSGRVLSLISKSEAAKLGGQSDVSEAEATEFIEN